MFLSSSTFLRDKNLQLIFFWIAWNLSLVSTPSHPFFWWICFCCAWWVSAATRLTRMGFGMTRNVSQNSDSEIGDAEFGCAFHLCLIDNSEAFEVNMLWFSTIKNKDSAASGLHWGLDLWEQRLTTPNDQAQEQHWSNGPNKIDSATAAKRGTQNVRSTFALGANGVQVGFLRHVQCEPDHQRKSEWMVTSKSWSMMHCLKAIHNIAFRLAWNENRIFVLLVAFLQWETQWLEPAALGSLLWCSFSPFCFLQRSSVARAQTLFIFIPICVFVFC